MNLTRRKFIYSSLAIGVGVTGYSRFAEPHWLEVTQTPVHLPNRNGKTKLKILQLSDLHASAVVSISFIEKAVEMGIAQEPDFICLTGDYITGKFDNFEPYAKILSKLSQVAPCVAILGNHDGGTWASSWGGYSNHKLVEDLLEKSGIGLLHNQSLSLKIKGANLRIVGVGDLWSKEFLPKAAFEKLNKNSDEVVILLSHNPDTKDLLLDYNWDLMLCGHTHGGQLVVPFLGLTPFAPVRDHKIVSGLHQWRQRQIYVTRGVGNLYGVRFNCRPEISIIEIFA
jgi:uncharacterized protein